MNLYALVENNFIVKFPAELFDLKENYPYTSFESVIPKEGYPEMGFVPVKINEQPEWDNEKETCVLGSPYFSNDQVVVDWKISPLSIEELEEKKEQRSTNMRRLRNYKLVQCDWTQFPDAPVDGSVWLEYRQALRDVPSQPGFPWDVVWPAEPV